MKYMCTVVKSHVHAMIKLEAVQSKKQKRKKKEKKTESPKL